MAVCGVVSVVEVVDVAVEGKRTSGLAQTGPVDQSLRDVVSAVATRRGVVDDVVAALAGLRA